MVVLMAVVCTETVLESRAKHLGQGRGGYQAQLPESTVLTYSPKTRCDPQGLIETQCPVFSLGSDHTSPSAWQVRNPDSRGEHVHSMSHVLAQTGYAHEPPISESGGKPLESSSRHCPGLALQTSLSEERSLRCT